MTTDVRCWGNIIGAIFTYVRYTEASYHVGLNYLGFFNL
jgi:hypothetical protein